MSPIPECHTLVIGGSIHSFPCVLRVVLADFFEAEAVECFWRWVDGRVHCYGLGGNTDGGVARDGEAVGEGVGFVDYAFECD